MFAPPIYSADGQTQTSGVLLEDPHDLSGRKKSIPVVDSSEVDSIAFWGGFPVGGKTALSYFEGDTSPARRHKHYF